ncbi:Swm2p KNAG_0H01780 [Huiozyma naganishii CBS 8797]|uniref:Nucleolar protein SWM2 n=1 Tax=Huiozyma naganishii (strain ATCC MYA-139 / BCRC 22969 / CBS 8797 / KCTC 17520 / NBRC 10181 / NCYC 3082 / Yp74L-3) TaxID=1071383 RepID=J7RPG8_HUIN7|nr:hypothetical protein KNAG_0H01780 [Kazachstania naganishii CBS 8797]CCK71593.1 hypothetical protein KNAG_0H01780 [Kazachstania naganishii CBS 8797]
MNDNTLNPQLTNLSLTNSILLDIVLDLEQLPEDQTDTMLSYLSVANLNEEQKSQYLIKCEEVLGQSEQVRDVSQGLYERCTKILNLLTGKPYGAEASDLSNLVIEETDIRDVTVEDTVSSRLGRTSLRNLIVEEVEVTDFV